jgi:uncharacterized protein (DUF4415 family)
MAAKKERTEYIILKPGVKPPKGKTDWARVDATTDEDIARDVAADPDLAPLLDEEWFKNATWVLPDPKVAISIRLDKDVLAWFRQRGRRYQTRINAVLKAYVSAQPATRRTRRKKH